MQAYSNTLSSRDLEFEKPHSMVKEIDKVILAADANRNVLIFHSPKNFGGTRTLSKNKVFGLIGLGTQAMWVQINLISALTNCNIVVPTVQELSDCKTAQEVNDIPIPAVNGFVGFERLVIFIPTPALRNAMFATNIQDPIEQIPLMTTTARDFDNAAQANNMQGTALTHADDLNAWLYRVKWGLINETRYNVISDNKEAANFFNNRHLQCISNARQGLAQGRVVDNDAILQQLTTAISAQKEAATASNNLLRNKIQHQVMQEESNKDQTKKIHPSIVKMVACAAAAHSNDENKDPPATFTRFINCKNVGMAQYNLIHQSKEQGFPDIVFALGTTQALFFGEFLYSDLSTLSNFTVFAFHEQEPKANNCQQDYLICHLLQVEGQKKPLDKIKASLKQPVNVPTDYNGLGTQIQLFIAASNIFFGNKSIYTTNLRQLLLLISRNKKSFRNQIALDEFFAAKFLFAVNRRVQ
jgi:hypothetical protein